MKKIVLISTETWKYLLLVQTRNSLGTNQSYIHQCNMQTEKYVEQKEMFPCNMSMMGLHDLKEH